MSSLSRRSMLLALGGVALLAGCGQDEPAHGLWQQSPGLPGDSHPGAEPSLSAPDTLAKANPPAGGVCPAIPGAGTAHPGGPQYYLPCQGTQIALPVDDGPDPTYILFVLVLLALFFVLVF